jgi:hypothetical protein
VRFEPKSEEEIKADQRVVLERGEYDVEVVEAVPHVSSQTQNESIKLTLVAVDSDGRKSFRITDYLTPAVSYKLRHFCEACGLMDEYERGELEYGDCRGQTLRAQLRKEQEHWNDKVTGEPRSIWKNEIADYVPQGSGASSNRPAPAAAPASMSLPGPEEQAKKAFLVVWNQHLNEFPADAPHRGAVFKAAVEQYCQSAYGDVDARGFERVAAAFKAGRFNAATKVWTQYQPNETAPLKPAAKKAPAAGPKRLTEADIFGGSQEFKDSDIPF